MPNIAGPNPSPRNWPAPGIDAVDIVGVDVATGSPVMIEGATGPAEAGSALVETCVADWPVTSVIEWATAPDPVDPHAAATRTAANVATDLAST